MKNCLHKKIGIIIMLILSILIFSQGLWLREQIDREQLAFVSRLENNLNSIINFHALKGYSTKHESKPNIATLFVDERKKETTTGDSHELARYDINTSKYKKNFSLYKAIEAIFTDKSLTQGKIKLRTIDSLFRKNFNEIKTIEFYKMELLKNEKIIDSILIQGSASHDHKKFSNKEIVIISLGTTNTYTFQFKFKLRTFPFLKQMLYTISISGIAVILVAIFMLWLLGALQQRIDELQWREQAVSGIVHDLKSPLAYVYTFLDYIVSKVQQPSLEDQLMDASANISKLTNKIELILTLFGNKNQKIRLNPTNFKIKQVCTEVLSELKVVYQHKEIECKLDIPDDLLIKVDNFYFEAVLRNLMDNALKYSDSHPKLFISTKKKQNELHLYFTDSGMGISKKDQKKVFRELYRSNSTSKGHGIGLSFSLKVVKSHHGYINLSSEIKKGSTFCIILPANIIVS